MATLRRIYRNSKIKRYTTYTTLGVAATGAVAAGVYYYMHPEAAGAHFTTAADYTKGAASKLGKFVSYLKDNKVSQKAAEYTGKTLSTIFSPFKRVYGWFSGNNAAGNESSVETSTTTSLGGDSVNASYAEAVPGNDVPTNTSPQQPNTSLNNPFDEQMLHLFGALFN